MFSNFSSELYNVDDVDDADDVVLVEVVAVAVSPFTPVDASNVTKCFEERGENNEDVREGDLDDVDVDDDEINARIDDGVIMLNASAAGIVSVTIAHIHTHTHILRLVLILKDVMMDTVN